MNSYFRTFGEDEMRVLRLGSSLDTEGETPPDLLASAIASRMLAEASGEAVETVLERPWPGATMPGIVEGWVRDSGADLVCFNLSSRSRDRLHFGPEMHRRCGEMQGRLLVAAWQAANEPRAVAR